MGDQRDKGLQRVGDILPKLIDKRDIKPFTPMLARLLAPMAESGLPQGDLSPRQKKVEVCKWSGSVTFL